MYQHSEINTILQNISNFYWMIVFKICFKVFKNIWLWGFLCLYRSLQNSCIRNIKIKHFSQPFYRKIRQNLPHLYLALDAGFCPHHITATLLIKVANDIQLAESVANVFHYRFSWSLSHIWHGGSFYPLWNPFLSWFPFSFILYMILFSTMALKHV